MTDSLHQILCAGLSHGLNAVALFDSQDRLCFANSVFVERYQVDTPHDTDFCAIMRACHARKQGLLIISPDIDAWLTEVLSRRRRAASRSYEADFVDGRWFWVTETLLPDGWLYYNGADISALKTHEYAILRARDAALLAADTDALTGLGNRRIMLQSLQLALQGAGAACMIDLDHFKKINDTYGHPAGDRVLCHFAERASAQLRPSDRITRIGGEEFFLVLPGASVAQAETVLTRLRISLQQDPMLSDLPTLRYSFSAGITGFTSGENCEDILRRADAALYQAKQGGRDCHKVAPDEPAKV